MRFIAYSVWSLCSPIGISEKLLVRRAALYTHVDYIKGCCAIFSTYINSREGQHFSPCLGCQYIQTLFEGGRIKGRELSLPSSLYLSICRVLGIVCLHNSLLTFLLQITPYKEKNCQAARFVDESLSSNYTMLLLCREMDIAPTFHPPFFAFPDPGYNHDGFALFVTHKHFIKLRMEKWLPLTNNIRPNKQCIFFIRTRSYSWLFIMNERI